MINELFKFNIVFEFNLILFVILYFLEKFMSVGKSLPYATHLLIASVSSAIPSPFAPNS